MRHHSPNTRARYFVCEHNGHEVKKCQIAREIAGRRTLVTKRESLWRGTSGCAGPTGLPVMRALGLDTLSVQNKLETMIT